MPAFCAVVFAAALLLTTLARAQVSSYSIDERVLERGRKLFQTHCTECHKFDQSGIGPALRDVTSHAPYEYLAAFIVDPQRVIKSGDRRALDLAARYATPMPAYPQFASEDVHALLSFLNNPRGVAKSISSKTGLGTELRDPLPKKIAKAGMTLHLQQFTIAPATSLRYPVARINQTYALNKPNGAKRLFLLDQRGKLYEIKNGKFVVVMDMAKEKPAFVNDPGLGTGWGSYTFHPDFYENGLMYSTHSEKAGSVPADFRYDAAIPVALQWVLTEWKIKDPDASVFNAEPRELLRLDMPSVMHGMQQIAFNPTAPRGSPDYGLLYVGIGDGGSAENGYPQLCDASTQIRGAVLRIDPSARNSKNGKYGLPATNPWVGAKSRGSLGELFARGFRNPNRFIWTREGKMLITDIGSDYAEELNIGKAGADYGWPVREGTFLLSIEGDTTKVYPLPAHEPAKYTYPVAEYDHDEGHAISGGFVYDGTIAALKGKYIFGDIVMGRVFYVESGELKLGKQATIKEFDLQFGGRTSTFLEMVRTAKADLRFGLSQDNELYLFTKTDGKIWQVKDCTVNSLPPNAQ